MTAKNSNIVFILLCLGAWAMAGLCLEMGTATRRHLQPLPSPLNRPLPPKLTRFSLMAALGDQSRAAADWAYIDCLQYLGNNVNRNDGHFGQTDVLYREVLWLDPSFHQAVREGASVMGWNQRRIEAAHRYMEDAIRFDPSHERMKLYLAGLAYANVNNSAGMIEVLRPELSRPDAPELLLRMVGNIYLKEKDWEGATTYWTWLKSRAKEERTKTEAVEALRMAKEKIPEKRK